LKTPEVVERARATGMAIRFMPPADLDATVKADLAYWSNVIRNARISAD
jgi:tripartite-type tricarboxylate transporter receptor subunit TctC